jgi:hypothetical protein
MAVVDPIRSPDLCPWQNDLTISSDILPVGSTSEDESKSFNGWHSPTNGNGKAEQRHLDSHSTDENASSGGYMDQETTAHESEGGEVEDESVEDEDDDDDDEEEEEGDDDYEDEEEDEPTLKYERMSGAINDLLKKDSASALAVSNKLLVILSL